MWLSYTGNRVTEILDLFLWQNDQLLLPFLSCSCRRNKVTQYAWYHKASGSNVLHDPYNLNYNNYWSFEFWGGGAERWSWPMVQIKSCRSSSYLCGERSDKFTEIMRCVWVLEKKVKHNQHIFFVWHCRSKLASYVCLNDTVKIEQM